MPRTPCIWTGAELTQYSHGPPPITFDHEEVLKLRRNYCQALVPNPLVPNPQSRGLGMAIKSYRSPPHHHDDTFFGFRSPNP